MGCYAAPFAAVGVRRPRPDDAGIAVGDPRGLAGTHGAGRDGVDCQLSYAARCDGVHDRSFGTRRPDGSKTMDADPGLRRPRRGHIRRRTVCQPCRVARAPIHDAERTACARRRALTDLYLMTYS